MTDTGRHGGGRGGWRRGRSWRRGRLFAQPTVVYGGGSPVNYWDVSRWWAAYYAQQEAVLQQLQQAQQLGQYAPDDADDLRDAIERLTVEVAELQEAGVPENDLEPFGGASSTGHWSGAGYDARTGQADPASYVRCTSHACRIFPRYIIDPNRTTHIDASKAWNESIRIPPDSRLEVLGGAIVDVKYNHVGGEMFLWSDRSFLDYIPNRSGGARRYYLVRFENRDGWIDAQQVVAELPSYALTPASTPAPVSNVVGPARRLGRGSSLGPSIARATDAASLFAAWQGAKQSGRQTQPVIDALYARYSRAAAAERRTPVTPDYAGPLPQAWSGGASSAPAAGTWG